MLESGHRNVDVLCLTEMQTVKELRDLTGAVELSWTPHHKNRQKSLLLIEF